jgi:hypothetical protein
LLFFVSPPSSVSFHFPLFPSFPSLCFPFSISFHSLSSHSPVQPWLPILWLGSFLHNFLMRINFFKSTVSASIVYSRFISVQTNGSINPAAIISGLKRKL